MRSEEFRPGLEGMVVAETRLSRVDGGAGQLWLAGVPVAAVAGRSLEAVTLRLVEGAWPSTSEEASRRRALGAARVAVWPGAVRGMRTPGADGMTAVMAAVASADLDEEDPVAVAAAVGVGMAAWAAARAGRGFAEPDPDAGHAADLLRLMGGDGSTSSARAFNTYLATVIDHGLNASTFTARVVASTRSDLRSVALAGIAALKGPLHGGAPGPVLDMLDAVEATGDAEAWLRGEIAAGRRIMGMGHRVYRVRDPRAAVLEEAAKALVAEAPGLAGRIGAARRLEGVAQSILEESKPGRRIRANVEFYTAVLLEAVGVPREAFSPVFAAARVFGWMAHAEEQRRTGRLMRPRARYVGPAVV